MPDFDAKEFLSLCEELYTGDSDFPLSLRRTIAGRGYYAIYLSLRQRITATCGDCFGASGKHTSLYRACNRSTTAELPIVGAALVKLYVMRIRADYKWAEADNITNFEAEDVIDTATEIFPTIAALTPQHLLELHGLVRFI